MAKSIQDKIIRSFQTTDDLYHRLVLLVGETGTGKTSVLHAVADSLGTPVINVNLALSAKLLDLTAKQRILRLPKILDEIISLTQSPLVLDNLEILFDKDLKQDPLRLLQGISRNRSLVASWSGTVSKGKLLYAETGHPEYQNYALGDTLIVGMDGTSTIDASQEIESAGQT
jgi:hypothetical protein